MLNIQLDLRGVSYLDIRHRCYQQFIIFISINKTMISNSLWHDYSCLNPKLIQNLHRSGLETPTAIQAEVFANYKNYYDFLIASQTGSGKTLAFAAPMVSELMHLCQGCALPRKPVCLILTPTRQLAQQIQQVIKTITKQSKLQTISILGGLSAPKQKRILLERHPNIVIGTPGRIHELLNEEILDFSMLKYLVIDEADRMIEMGHYIELDEILNKIFSPKLEETFENDYKQVIKQLDEKSLKHNQYYIKEHGKKKKIKLDVTSMALDQLVQMPAHLFPLTQNHINTQQQDSRKLNKSHRAQLNDQTQEQDYNQDVYNKLKRRIFFISATLTKEFKGTKYYRKKRHDPKQQKKGKNSNAQEDELTPKLKALLSRVKFGAKPKIIDQSSQLFLPAKLKEMYCFCEGDLDKMAIMLCYLKQLPKQSKTIIFANTIKASKRVQFFVQSAGFKPLILHSHMLQKQRLKKLQQFKKSSSNVMISTDVAARGLDFEISNVLQFMVPINGDTYVHRVGRTARANKPGEALILISKKEVNQWEQISSVVASDSSKHKSIKYAPLGHQMQKMASEVERYEWIRQNQLKDENRRIEKLNRMQAEELGIVVDGPLSLHDKEQQELQQHKIRHKIKAIQKINHQEHLRSNEFGDGKVWKKNKLVLSLDEIKKFL